MINHIHSDALSAKDDNVSLAKDIKHRICTDLDSRYLDTKIKTLLNITSFLDPRFKMEHVAEEDRIATKEEVVEERLGVFSTLTEKEVMVESQPLSTDLDETEEPPAAKKSKLARILKRSSKDSDDPQVITLRDKVRKEVQYYIDTPCLDVEEDPLQCWASESSKYPCLSQLAMKYLSVCATSSPSECVFSASGKIVTPLRSNLKPDKVDKLVFVSQNL